MGSQGYLAVQPEDNFFLYSELDRFTAAELKTLCESAIGVPPGAGARKEAMIEMLKGSTELATVKQMRYLRDLIRKKEGSRRAFTLEEVRSKRHASVAISAFIQRNDRHQI